MFLKRIIGIFLFLGLLNPARSQGVLTHQPEQDACGAIPICSSFTCPYVYNGYGLTQEQQVFSNGCFDESNSVWLKLKIGVSGTMVFAITPINIANNYNFSVFNATSWPLCNTFSNPSVRCNYSYMGGVTGLAAVPTPNFSDSLNVHAGEEYFLLIDNQFSTNFPATWADGFSIDFAGSTASFVNDAVLHFDAVKNTCNKSQQLTVKLSEPVKCSSIASDGSDFLISPITAPIVGAFGYNCSQPSASSGYSNDITIQFGSPIAPGNYVLHTSPANNIRDLCNEGQMYPDSILFTVDNYSPVAFTGIDSPACQFLVVGLSHRVLCDSISADGSDFRVEGPSPVSIAAASGTNCNAYGLTDTVLVALNEPIAVDGTYNLISQKGSDHNTLMDSCTGLQLEGDKISFQINSFNGLLNAFPDTILCKADTIQVFSTSLSWMDPTICGTQTGSLDNNCFSSTRELLGIPGTSTFSSFASLIFGYTKGNRMQMLFHAAELSAMGFKAGSISRIAWTIQHLQFPYQIDTLEEFAIKMGCSSLSAIGLGGNGSMVAGLQTVYSKHNYFPAGDANNIVDITLDTAYNWDGVSNLIVEICSSNVLDGPYATVPQTKLSTTPFASTIAYMSNTQEGCALMASSYPPYSSFQRPDTRFTICSPPLPTGGLYDWLPENYVVEDEHNPNTVIYTPSSQTFTVSTTDRFGCYLRDTIRIIVSELDASIHPVDTFICQGDVVQMDADAGTAPAFYSWITDQPSSLTCLTCQNPIASPVVDSCLYHLVISDELGCADTVISKISVNPLPQVAAAPKDTLIKYGSRVQLAATGADYYSWSPSVSLTIPFINNPLATPLDPTTYIVTGLSINGCRNSDSVIIAIDYLDNLFIPTVFSPNGDGKNDLFKVVNLSFQRIQEFKVFNRWGQMVYNAFDNKGWDGTINGDLQDIGVYNYLIKVGFPDGYSKTYKGDVTLLK